MTLGLGFASNIVFIFNNIFTKEQHVHIGTYHDAPHHDAPHHDAPHHDAPHHDAPQAAGGLIFSSLIEHNDICKTSYLVDLKTHTANTTLINTAFHANSDSYICLVKQPLAIINGYIHKIATHWTVNCELYKLMSNARETLIGEPLADLSPIQQGYLIALLRKRRGGTVVNPFYGLAEEWQQLIDTEDTFQSAPVQVHVKLINLGLLHYFDVNAYLRLAITSESWETVSQIITYYGTSPRISQELKQALKLKVDSHSNVPLDVIEWIKSDRIITRKPFNQAQPLKPGG